MANLALRAHVGKYPNRNFIWNVWVGYMQLVHVDAFEAQASQAAFQSFSQVFWPAIRLPLVWTRTKIATFCRNHKLRRIRVKCLGNQRLGHLWSIRVCRIYQIHTQFNCATKHGNRFIFVLRRSPDAGTRQLHGTKPKAIDGQVSADSKCSTCRNGRLIRTLHDISLLLFIFILWLAVFHVYLYYDTRVTSEYRAFGNNGMKTAAKNVDMYTPLCYFLLMRLSQYAKQMNVSYKTAFR